MPTDKRQRQKEARLARLEAERKAAQRATARRRVITGVIIAAGVFAILFLISVVGGDDGNDTADQASGTTTTTLAPRQDKPEVTVPDPLPAELEITDITVGDGPEAKLGDSITVDYVGVKASDGSEFDSSYDGPEPATFTLAEGGLIQGWIEGIPGMRVGGRRMLVIPPDLAYGDTGQGDIGPGETLVFIIDLLGVASPGSADPPPPVQTGE
jgi:peptidylprolyl isomerase